MNLPIPDAPEKYDRAVMQQIVNALRELQQKVFLPNDSIAFTDFSDGAPKLLRINADATEVIDP